MPLLGGEIKEDIKKQQHRPEAFSPENVRHSLEGEFMRLDLSSNLYQPSDSHMYPSVNQQFQRCLEHGYP